MGPRAPCLPRFPQQPLDRAGLARASWASSQAPVAARRCGSKEPAHAAGAPAYCPVGRPKFGDGEGLGPPPRRERAPAPWQGLTDAGRSFHPVLSQPKERDSRGVARMSRAELIARLLEFNDVSSFQFTAA